MATNPTHSDRHGSQQIPEEFGPHDENTSCYDGNPSWYDKEEKLRFTIIIQAPANPGAPKRRLALRTVILACFYTRLKTENADIKPLPAKTEWRVHNLISIDDMMKWRDLLSASTLSAGSEHLMAPLNLLVGFALWTALLTAKAAVFLPPTAGQKLRKLSHVLTFWEFDNISSLDVTPPAIGGKIAESPRSDAASKSKVKSPTSAWGTTRLFADGPEDWKWYPNSRMHGSFKTRTLSPEEIFTVFWYEWPAAKSIEEARLHFECKRRGAEPIDVDVPFPMPHRKVPDCLRFICRDDEGFWPPDWKHQLGAKMRDRCEWELQDTTPEKSAPRQQNQKQPAQKKDELTKRQREQYTLINEDWFQSQRKQLAQIMEVYPEPKGEVVSDDGGSQKERLAQIKEEFNQRQGEQLAQMKEEFAQSQREQYALMKEEIIQNQREQVAR
ncbi:hypothetical protein K402DRAFT_416712 [Aulographum hederae CBS 113979]|uniref:Uncharacterized protein n=1 Tax=Aulographum hederae CBS 113979 TaxID=1176131 RepID=A0A6G1HEE9_9PEZI|nr:hypothetical protein K402DRAFT_416712 [Aulographum hederae CBS 113979]